VDIKKFNNFIDNLNEAFETPVEINWTKSNELDLDGEFYVDQIRYIIECFNWYNDIWSYKFSRIEGDEKVMDLIEDSLRKMRVLSTIREGMKYLIENKNPKGLIINVTDSSRGREYLWGRFAEEVSKNYNYEMSNKKIMGYTSIFLWKDINFNDITIAFNKMLRVFQSQ